ncbi:MAG: hypothetical protein R3C03_03770 [Pirellulaceae bacterium]
MSFSTTGGANMAFVGSGPGMMVGDQFSMLGNAGIQEELNLVGDQLDQYNQLQDSYRQQMNDVMKDIRSGNFDSLKSEEFRQKMKDLEERKRDDIKGLLLPQQLDRLKQISFQQNVKSMGAENALQSKELMEELGLNDEDLKKLREKAQELRKQMQEKIEKLQSEMRNELLGTLTKDQQEKIKDMMGEKFDYQAEFPGIRRIRRTGSDQNDN